MSYTHKKIGWESWNAKVEHVMLQADETSVLEELLNSNTEEHPEEFKLIESHPRVIHTPYGPFFLDSKLKPSDRRNCWTGYTNFDITKDVLNKIEDIEGVEALKILGRYTLFVGIGKMFDPTLVRLTIEEQICNHKEIEEDLDSRLGKIITNIKDQVTHSSYWSIFISPEGDVDYIMSDDMDEKYIQSLKKFEKLKSKFGGIILRSTNE